MIATTIMSSTTVNPALSVLRFPLCDDVFISMDVTLRISRVAV
jgi:hypothetical protein